jgi:hypothetical protein
MGNTKRRRPRRNQGHSEAGFGRPPQHSKWKPGQSGNPKGRPKGTRNFKTDVQATLRALIRVTREGKPRKISTQEAILLRLLEKALHGDVRALAEALQLARTYNNDEFAASASLPVEDENVLRIYRERLLSGAASANSDLIDQAMDSSST